MPEDVKLLSSRRAYEFGTDELRLTTLSMAAIVQQIQQRFNFQNAGVGTPPLTFGPVTVTMPPGLVFNNGGWATPEPEGQIIPIRSIHFEPRRIVIDVAGPSSCIDTIFTALYEFLGGLKAPDGAPVISKPHRTLDYSDLVARLAFPLEAPTAPGLQGVFARALGVAESVVSEVLVPTITVQVQSLATEYPGVAPSDSRFLQLALRAGTKPDEHIYFSSAPLDSEAHLRYLSELETLLAM
jgi:hypothetical protein